VTTDATRQDVLSIEEELYGVSGVKLSSSNPDVFAMVSLPELRWDGVDPAINHEIAFLAKGDKNGIRTSNRTDSYFTIDILYCCSL
jgi:hypothetical protein